MNAPFTAPAHWPDVLVLFEDIELYPNTNTPFTWRVVIAYADPDNWFVADVQLDAWGKGWIDIDICHPLRPVLVARTQARDLRDEIDAAILADMEPHNPARGTGDVNAEHRMGAAAYGVGR